jgi:hypothetical protein
MDLLKLIALDKDDLAVVSTHLQDALVTVGDVVWRPGEKRLVIGVCRFDWEGALNNDAEFQRRRTALRFERVNALKCRNLNCKDKKAVLNLLAVEFDEHDAPGGAVTLTFSGGAALRVEVECLECELVDLGPVWATTCCPSHADDAPARADDARADGAQTG